MKKRLLSLTLLLSFAAIHFAPLSAADPAQEIMRLDFTIRDLRERIIRLQVEEQQLMAQLQQGIDVNERLEAVRAVIRGLAEGIHEHGKKVREMGDELR